MIHSHKNLNGYCSYYEEWDAMPRPYRKQLKEINNAISEQQNIARADENWGLFFRLKDIKILINRGEIHLSNIMVEIQKANNVEFSEVTPYYYYKFLKSDKLRNTLEKKYYSKLTEQKSKMCIGSYKDYLDCSDYCLEICEKNKRPLPFKINLSIDLWQTKDSNVLYTDKEIFLEMLKYLKAFKKNNEKLLNINRVETIIDSITI